MKKNQLIAYNGSGSKNKVRGGCKAVVQINAEAFVVSFELTTPKLQTFSLSQVISAVTRKCYHGSV